ncbi:MAG: hypothetical protein ACFFE4_12095 [Candidatus Thorarchaeota archaeon]
MSILSEEVGEAKERLKAWWDHEIIDRPCIAYNYPKVNKKDVGFVNVIEYLDPWYLAQDWDGFEPCLEKFEEHLKSIKFGGEAVPRFWPNYGPGIMASIFGIIPKYQSNTVWFHKETSVDEIVSVLEKTKLNRNNPWYDRLLKIVEYSSKRAKDKYFIALPDLGGVLDILSSFLGPTNIILTMKRKPGIIDTCRSIILEKLIKVYNDLQTIIEREGNGCLTWLPIWCPKRWYPIQSDFSSMLSPKYFQRFTLPDLITQAENLDFSIFHLDGPHLLPHLDDLLKQSTIHGIQWAPGAGERNINDEKWLPLYKKIQKQGKNLIIGNPGEVINIPALFYKNLDPKGLFTYVVFTRKLNALYYLPEFMGGNGAEKDYKIFKKEFRIRAKNE